MKYILERLQDTWHSNILISRTTKWVYNFEKDDVEALKNIEIPFDFVVLRTAFLHGVGKMPKLRLHSHYSYLIINSLVV